LQPGDTLHLVPVPGHETAKPKDLEAIARSLYPDLACQTHSSLRDGLAALDQAPSSLKVLCGSLYLIGHFLATEPYTDRLQPVPSSS
ncbi:MAG: bifunctional folylpolyglutamate synthase/dihydrofolate synthase, partial [Nodosilinea sp.]